MNNQQFIDRYAPFAEMTGVAAAAQRVRGLKRPGHVYFGDYAERAKALERQIGQNVLMEPAAKIALLSQALSSLRKQIVKFYGLRDKPAGYYK